MERQVTVDLEPMQPIKSFIYLCDSRFHIENLNALCVDENDEKYGFIVIDGNGTLLGLLQGSNAEVLHQYTVDLPNKHRKGGQSALRFQRLHEEKRNNFVRKVAELAAKYFLVDNRPNVTALVVAGRADCKNELLKYSAFSKVLRSIVVGTFDVSYSGERGFYQAIDLSAEAIGSTKIIQEKRLLEQFREEMAQDSGKYCLSVQDTFQALEMGAVENLIVWEDLEVNRYVLHDEENGEQSVVFLSVEEESMKNASKAPNGGKFVVVDKVSLVDWLCDNYQIYGCTLSLISARTAAGTQFAQGFGGIGGILLWKIDFVELNGYEHDESDEDGTGQSDAEVNGA